MIKELILLSCFLAIALALARPEDNDPSGKALENIEESAVDAGNPLAGESLETAEQRYGGWGGRGGGGWGNGGGYGRGGGWGGRGGGWGGRGGGWGGRGRGW